MKYILIYLLVITLIITTVYLSTQKGITIDENTKELCREYADRNHEKEIAPERWKADHGWIEKFDWYGSCINHIKYPVAK